MTMLDCELLLPGDWIDSAIRFHRTQQAGYWIYGTLLPGPGLTMKVDSLPRPGGVLKVGDIWVATHALPINVVDTEAPIEGRIPSDQSHCALMRELSLMVASKRLLGESASSVPVQGREASLTIGDYLTGRMTRDIHGARVLLNAMELGEVTAIEWDVLRRGVRVDGHAGRYWVFSDGETAIVR